MTTLPNSTQLIWPVHWPQRIRSLNCLVELCWVMWLGLPTNWTENTGHPSLLPLPSLPSLPLEVGPLNPARGSEEHCKLPQRGLGQSPSRNRIWCILALIMTSGGNSFNDFPENQLAKFQLGGKNVTILHTFAALFQYHLSTAQKRWHLASREGLGRDAGQWGQNTGRPGKYGTVGNPGCDHWTVATLDVITVKTQLNWAKIASFLSVVKFSTFSEQKTSNFFVECLEWSRRPARHASTQLSTSMTTVPDAGQVGSRNVITALYRSMHYTVKPLMFVCPLFPEFCEPNKTAKLKGANINCRPK